MSYLLSSLFCISAFQFSGLVYAEEDAVIEDEGDAVADETEVEDEPVSVAFSLTSSMSSCLILTHTHDCRVPQMLVLKMKKGKTKD